ncbi:hypothetical protein HMPREF1546_00463 [Oscillibacter sp. KLE 1745]|jgi:hypothetical protein|nr:hypothetical protein HMPREF1546_00463 [Oscillibacter sp. KLE 1745]
MARIGEKEDVALLTNPHGISGVTRQDIGLLKLCSGQIRITSQPLPSSGSAAEIQ